MNNQNVYIVIEKEESVPVAVASTPEQLESLLQEYVGSYDLHFVPCIGGEDNTYEGFYRIRHEHGTYYFKTYCMLLNKL